MNGSDCPRCGKTTIFIATTNQYTYICKPCNFRFNYLNQPMPSLEELTRNDLFPNINKRGDKY